MESATETQQRVVVTEGHRGQPLSEKELSFDAVKTCRQIIKNLSNKPLDKITGDFVESLEQRSKDYKTLRSFYYKERHRERIPKAKLENLKEKGLSTDSISEDEAIISSNLYQALYLTYRFLYETDTASPERVETLKHDYMKQGAKANIAFANFFIDLYERYRVSEERLDRITDLLLLESPLGRDLQERDDYGRMYGIKAAYRGYIYLAKTKPGWEIHTPIVALDLNHGIDMVATSKQKNEEHYYQIKGSGADKVQLTDVSSAQNMEKVREDIVFTSKRRRKELTSLGNLYDFVRNKAAKGDKVKAYWLQVPI